MRKSDCSSVMKSEMRIVSQMPLREIWDEHGIVSENTICKLNSSDVTDLLRSGRVRFVVADIGQPLQWLPSEECYEFWKFEAATHIAEPEAKNYLENGGNELSSESQIGEILNHVKIYCWNDEQMRSGKILN